ncbi:LuxR C-terminal-related transcriptional regulator [Streptomyces sp. SP17BM10]|uniref:helix-turn-helix transcriptional regulator n=1 Tax=Streptomyces sp. SP17BM10 TaxID=3002530 RepID=UPI002E774FDB|nr:AAA family ATPase [Streptomyces sp. SP17BM10]MEE1782236.1 LuxR C-terminal-related transcriptional regulator [Streptomyces sp. SP17BM10]
MNDVPVSPWGETCDPTATPLDARPARPGTPDEPRVPPQGEAAEDTRFADRSERTGAALPAPAPDAAPARSGTGPGTWDASGRQRERAFLASVLDEAFAPATAAARPVVLAVTGAPGYGQNALVRWGATRAERAGLRVLRARAAHAESALALGAVAQWLGSLDGPHDRPLAGPLAGLAEVLAAARARPTVLALEDAQWLDAGSLHWLGALSRRWAGVPLVLLCGGSRLGTPDPDWYDLLTGTSGTATVHRLALGPLDGTDVARAVRRACGGPGEEGFVTAAGRISAGHPEVLDDILRRFAGDGHHPVLARVPELAALGGTVTGDHLMRALRGQSAEVVAVVRALAVCGDLLDFPLTCLLAGLDTLNETRLRAVLAELPGVVTGPGLEPLLVPAMRSRVLAAATAAERAELHTRAAELAHRAAADDLAVAALLLGAGPAGHPWAVRALRTAAEAAAQRQNQRHAAALLGRALAEHPAPADHARLTLELAATHLIAEPEAGDHTLDAILRRPAAVGSAAGSYAAPAGSAAGSYAAPAGSASGSYAAAAEANPYPALTSGLPHATDADSPPYPPAPDAVPRPRSVTPTTPSTPTPALRVRAADLGITGGAATVVRRAVAETLPRPEEPYHDELLALFWCADPSDDGESALPLPELPQLPACPTVPAQAAVRAWQLAVGGRRLDLAGALARTALAAAGSAGDDACDGPLVQPWLAACRTLCLADANDEAQAGLDRLLRSLSGNRLRLAAPHVLALRAELNLRRGRLEPADRDVAEGERALRLLGRPDAVAPYLRAVGILVDLESGRRERARERAVAALPAGAEASEHWAHLLFARATVALGSGRPAEAVELLRECGRRLLSRHRLNPALLPWRSVAALAHHALGDPDEAVRLSEQELRLARRWGAPIAIGWAELSAQRVADRPGRLAGIRSAATDALRSGAAGPGYVRALAELAAVELAEGGDRHAAERSLAELCVLTARHPAGPMASRARDLAGTLDHRVVHPADPRWDSLTPTERHTAELAGRGHSNRDIAALLAVSSRAVELRLKRAYAKLGIHGRPELRALVLAMEGH